MSELSLETFAAFPPMMGHTAREDVTVATRYFFTIRAFRSDSPFGFEKYIQTVEHEYEWKKIVRTHTMDRSRRSQWLDNQLINRPKYQNQK